MYIIPLKPDKTEALPERINEWGVGPQNGHQALYVLNDNGTVKCWGEGDNGRLGDGYTTDRTYPLDVYNLSNASQTVTGNDFTRRNNLHVVS